MSDDITKAPQIRFAGFTDGWKPRKVGEFLTESQISGTNGLKAKKLTVKLWSKGIVPKDEVYQGSEATKYYIRKAGQFMYGKLDFLNQAFGIVPLELEGYESTLDSPAFDISEGLNSKFFLEYISRKSFYQYQGNLANGSRKAKRIHADTFFNMSLVIPSKEEQTKIGTFFKQLDETIALHRRKLELLKEMKKSLLQKMFSKDGANFPEIRFAGFTDAWEHRALGQLGKVYTGNTPSTSDKDNWTDDENGHVWITPTDINSLVMSNSERHLSDKGWSKARTVPEKSVLITSIASIGKNVINTVPVAFNQQINAIVPEKNDTYFILAAMEKETSRFASLAGQTATAIINKTEFEKFTLAVPIIDEQKKIGEMFTHLDNLITLHQSELNSLENLKKSLLQQMFI